MVHGAPSPLLFAATRAAQDEIVHADASLALAGGNASVGPYSARAVTRLRTESLAALAVHTLREGGVNELLGVLSAAQSAAQAHQRQQRAVAGVWRAIATDEARHGLLAWRTVAWVLSQLSADAAAALLGALEREVALVHDGDIKRRLMEPMLKCAVANAAGINEFLASAAAQDDCVTNSLESLAIENFNSDAIVQNLIQSFCRD